MPTLYKTTSYSIDIEEVEAIAVTDKSVVLPHFRRGSRREMLRTDHQQYHRSRQDAIEFLITREIRKVAAARNATERAEAELAAVEERYGADHPELAK